MNFSLGFCEHFLYYNLPKIFMPKKVILMFRIDLKMWLKFVCFDSSVGAAPEEKSSQKISKNLKGLKKIEITCFGNYFLKNGIIKCYSELNSGQLSITSIFSP